MDSLPQRRTAESTNNDFRCAAGTTYVDLNLSHFNGAPTLREHSVLKMWKCSRLTETGVLQLDFYKIKYVPFSIHCSVFSSDADVLFL